MALSPVRPRTRFGSRRFRLALVLLALAGGIAYLAVIAARSGTAFYVTPTELLRDTEPGAVYRLGGRVIPDSIDWGDGALRFRIGDGDPARSFTFETGGQWLPVSYSGVVPDLFAERAFVVVEGTYTREGGFDASSLIIKHESEFLSERKKAAGE